MFNKKDTSNEIAASMEGNLLSAAINKQAESLNKFAKALDCLNYVAEIFDELGLKREAEATTTLLEVVTAKKKKKHQKSKSKSKSRKSSKPTKDLTSEKMVENLAEKGWVFNDEDGHHDSCMCSMCMDADDNYHCDPEDPTDSHYTDKNDVDNYENDEREQDLARRFHELMEEDEDRGLDEFEDEYESEPKYMKHLKEKY